MIDTLEELYETILMHLPQWWVEEVVEVEGFKQKFVM